MLPFILLAALLRLTLACPPTTNDTSTPGQGFFGPWFGNDKSGLWPKNSVGFATIPYCFLNKASYDRLSSQLDIGWAIWYSTIDHPGKDSGHALSLEYTTVPGSANPWCKDSEGNWNPDIPKHALVVYLDDNQAATGGTTTVGYTPDEKNSEAGRHWMRMGGSATDWDYAHELGHALGLLHEHQRPDRDEHVAYNCMMLDGYARALYLALQDGFSKGDLCNTAFIASKCGFAATQFVQNGDLVNGAQYSTEYDIHSIMHYTSRNFANPEFLKDHPDDPQYMPLTKREKDGPKEIIPEPKPFPDVDVTALDVQAIKAMYPWTGGSSGAQVESENTEVAVPSTFSTAVSPAATNKRQ